MNLSLGDLPPPPPPSLIEKLNAFLKNHQKKLKEITKKDIEKFLDN